MTLLSEQEILEEIREDVLHWKQHLRALSRQLAQLADKTDTLGDRASPLGEIMTSSTPHNIDRLSISIAVKRRIVGLR